MKTKDIMRVDEKENNVKESGRGKSAIVTLDSEVESQESLSDHSVGNKDQLNIAIGNESSDEEDQSHYNDNSNYINKNNNKTMRKKNSKTYSDNIDKC